MAISTPVNATVVNPIEAAMSALKSGQDVEATVYGGGSGPEDDATGGTQASSQDPLDSATDGGEASESPVTEGTEKKAVKAADFEEIIISDESGRKKLKVDWNDREKLKKYVQMAAGMRKFQAERDQAASKLKDIEPKYTELQDSWKAVESAYQQNGVRGLVELLGGEGAFKKFEEETFGKRKMREEATPEQLEQLDLKESLANERKERERLTKMVEENLKTASQKKEEADLANLESRVHPVFEKYRFAGKLGDPGAEEQLDEAMWSRLVKKLDTYPEGTLFTPAIVNKEMAEISASYNRIIKQQADKATEQTLAKKKQSAQENAATTAMNGMKRSEVVDDFKKNIKGGNLTDALKAFMTGKVRL